MQPALHIATKVLPGRRVEVASPDLEEGQPVDVYVIPSRGEVTGVPGGSALDVIESLGGHRLFKTPAEVDAHLRGERQSWDR